jgi:hypothetical protein
MCEIQANVEKKKKSQYLRMNSLTFTGTLANIHMHCMHVMSGWCPNLPYQNFDSIRYFGSYRQFAKELLFMRIFPPFSHTLHSNFDRRTVKESIADFRLANRWQNLVGQAMASPKQMPPDLEFYSEFFFLLYFVNVRNFSNINKLFDTNNIHSNTSHEKTNKVSNLSS